MRKAFIATLEKLAEDNERVMLLTADVGYSVLESFAEKFPDRFYNVGVAEQNMVGIATGLAEAGFIPFVYSIATFVSLRAYEFIRNGPILHKYPVRIIGAGGGFEYGHAGITHHALEDIGVMRLQHGITVIAPADYKQASNALLGTWNLDGPVYYRIGKDDKLTVPGLNGRFELGHTQLLSKGDDLLFIAMGSIAIEVVRAAEILKGHDISCTVVIVASLEPSPIDDLIEVLSRFRLVFTVEAHYVKGGLGSLISEIVADNNINCKVKRCGVNTMPTGSSGSQAYYYKKYALSGEMLADIALRDFLHEGKEE
ncbi:MAG: transketolase C-terminal domain-containing protein [Candidatus Omnitrophota bacterium]